MFFLQFYVHSPFAFKYCNDNLFHIIEYVLLLLVLKLMSGIQSLKGVPSCYYIIDVVVPHYVINEKLRTFMLGTT